VICRMFGADVHLTAPAKGSEYCEACNPAMHIPQLTHLHICARIVVLLHTVPGLKEYAEDLIAKNPDYFLANQFYNEANPRTHYETTGPEIWDQSGGKVDYFVTGVGTGGTATGAGRYLTEKNPNLKVVCVEPTESRVPLGEAHSPHTILGIGAGVPTNFLLGLAPDQPLGPGPRGHISEFGSCLSSEAIEWATKLAQMEGLMVGPSSGATMKVAMDVAKRDEAKGKTIVIIFASHGIRYTAHPLWGPMMEEAGKALPKPPNMDKEADLLLWTSP
jgi:cysteine synthase A